MKKTISALIVLLVCSSGCSFLTTKPTTWEQQIAAVGAMFAGSLTCKVLEREVLKPEEMNSLRCSLIAVNTIVAGTTNPADLIQNLENIDESVGPYAPEIAGILIHISKVLSPDHKQATLALIINNVIQGCVG